MDTNSHPDHLPGITQLGLFTDLYELTMAQGHLLAGRADRPVAFDYSFRSLPFGNGYVVFAGLGELLDALEALRFTAEDLETLRGYGMREEFLEVLASFRFRATVTSVREGELIFPLEPVLRVEGTMLEAQLVETLLLNILNFQSLVATKAARIQHAARGVPFMEFGLRRAQGTAGVQATRAAVIGGAAGTSNVLAGSRYGVHVAGTLAHSWVQSFDSELTAFRTYAEHYDDCALLVDTYNTLHSGIPNAITVARELAARGGRLRAIRLDSGDLAYLSKKARQMLDEAGLPEVKIYATNQLDEHLIKSLLDQGAPIDLFGVGTRLVTGHDASALDGVYKLVVNDGAACLKLSDNYTKVNFPGLKTLTRLFDADGMFYGDAISLTADPTPDQIFHPFFPEQNTRVTGRTTSTLMHEVMRDGVRTAPPEPLDEIAAYVTDRLMMLPDEHKRFANPHTYKVGVSQELLDLRRELYQQGRARYA